jgi:N-hydroxyarylamine O-acetyltransferase
MFDLDAYLARIGYTGPCTPSLETLSAIHLKHTESIAFENLDPFLRRPVRLDPDSIQQKLVHSGRGGYCFEQNLLLSYALRALNIDFTNLAARVLWGAPENHVGPRSHMLLLVKINGESYVADVGFGGQTLTSPLRLEADIEQQTPHGSFRLLRAGEGFVMQANLGRGWEPLYRFDLQEQFPADYEVTNWYLSNHPESRFVKGLLAARPAAGCRYALQDNQFTIYYLNGDLERRTLSSPAELRAVLENHFRLTLTGLPELEAALARRA